MTLNLSMPGNDELKPRITVFGVGGAGGNAVNNMIEKELDGVDFVVANTDAQALQQSAAPNRAFSWVIKVTEGLGRRGAAHPLAPPQPRNRSNRSSITWPVRTCAFITAGMGGGTGTGAAPIIAQAARELGCSDCRRRHQAVPVRGRQAHEAGRRRRRGAAKDGRYADHHSEPEPVPSGQ